MKSNLLASVVEPLFLRLGTAVSAALVGYGMAATHQASVAQAVTLLAGVTFDLVLRRVWKGRP